MQTRIFKVILNIFKSVNHSVLLWCYLYVIFLFYMSNSESSCRCILHLGPENHKAVRKINYKVYQTLRYASVDHGNLNLFVNDLVIMRSFTSQFEYYYSITSCRIYYFYFHPNKFYERN